jgi:hypothetical protein
LALLIILTPDRPQLFAGSSEDLPMTAPTREQIIHRAYELWEQAGKPDGRDEEFYHEAEKELNEGLPGEEKSDELKA